MSGGTDSYVTVNEGTAKKVRMINETIGSNNDYTEVVYVADPATGSIASLWSSDRNPATIPVKATNYSGTVAISNFPATQAVTLNSTGTVAISGTPSVSVSGTISVSSGTINLGATATISLAGATVPVSGTLSVTQSGVWNIATVQATVTASIIAGYLGNIGTINTITGGTIGVVTSLNTQVGGTINNVGTVSYLGNIGTVNTITGGTITALNTQVGGTINNVGTVTYLGNVGTVNTITGGTINNIGTVAVAGMYNFSLVSTGTTTIKASAGVLHAVAWPPLWPANSTITLHNGAFNQATIFIAGFPTASTIPPTVGPFDCSFATLSAVIVGASTVTVIYL
jgi:hypothetical protein